MPSWSDNIIDCSDNILNNRQSRQANNLSFVVQLMNKTQEKQQTLAHRALKQV